MEKLNFALFHSLQRRLGRGQKRHHQQHAEGAGEGRGHQLQVGHHHGHRLQLLGEAVLPPGEYQLADQLRAGHAGPGHGRDAGHRQVPRGGGPGEHHGADERADQRPPPAVPDQAEADQEGPRLHGGAQRTQGELGRRRGGAWVGFLKCFPICFIFVAMLLSERIFFFFWFLCCIVNFIFSLL